MRRTLVLLTVTLAGVLALGQALPNPFDMGLGVRAMGFGGAYIAIAEGTEALLTNPAGLGWSAGLRADSSLSSVLGLYSVTWLAGSIPNFGAGLGYLGVGGITDPDGNPLAFSHLAAVVGAGFDLSGMRLFPFPAAGGMAFKFNRLQVADQAGSGFALDVGLLGRMSTPLGALRFGLALREFGFGPTVGETGDGWSTDLAAGVALVNPLGFLLALDITSEYTALGVGWSAFGAFEIRTGLRIQAGLQWAFGLGVRWGMFVIDYALLTHPVLSAAHRFGFGARF
ncbi:TPA: hypothetical protein DCY65_01275 [Candidatus Acetothermia bacterium]|nr:hypothetical protein [Candidatus Acetothermia bacterium]